MENTGIQQVIITYKIKCSKCFKQADAFMKESGIKGTYREVYLDYSPYRINCKYCGLLKEIENGKNFKYELWFRPRFKDHYFSAPNLRNL